VGAVGNRARAVFQAPCGRAVCVHGERRRPRPGRWPSATRGADERPATPGLSPFPEGWILPGATRAMGVTEEHPLRRKTAGFARVAPGITRGTFMVPRLLLGSALGPAGRRARCDGAAGHGVTGVVIQVVGLNHGRGRRNSRGMQRLGGHASCRPALVAPRLSVPPRRRNPPASVVGGDRAGPARRGRRSLTT
jgi:hypothetical protein